MKKGTYIDYNILLACLSGKKKATRAGVDALLRAACEDQTTDGAETVHALLENQLIAVS